MRGAFCVGGARMRARGAERGRKGPSRFAGAGYTRRIPGPPTSRVCPAFDMHPPSCLHQGASAPLALVIPARMQHSDMSARGSRRGSGRRCMAQPAVWLCDSIKSPYRTLACNFVFSIGFIFFFFFLPTSQKSRPHAIPGPRSMAATTRAPRTTPPMRCTRTGIISATMATAPWRPHLAAARAPPRLHMPLDFPPAV